MNIHEAAVVSSGLALCKVENQKFLGDMGDIIKHNLAEAKGMDLILLTKGSYYMRNFAFTKDVYNQVHA